MNAPVYHRKLARVLDRMGGLYTLNDILTAIGTGKMQSFAEGNSWAITQISSYPRTKVLEIIAVVGDIDELRILHDRIMVFAAEIGASVIQAYGRKGWITDAKQRGWRVKSRSFVYQKDM
jgi:hypothetical protein